MVDSNNSIAELNAIISVSSNISKPFCLSSAAVTPKPLFSWPVNEPSWIFLFDQDGLFALSRANLILCCLANKSAECAPRINSLLTTSSGLARTSVVPSSTLNPSPYWISAGARGVVNPPAISGHNLTNRFSARHCSIWTCSIGLALLSYRTGSPSRQALISILRGGFKVNTIMILSESYCVQQRSGISIIRLIAWSIAQWYRVGSEGY